MDMRRALTASTCSMLLAACAASQQIEMFPPGAFVAHCRAPADDLEGGDDDSVNIWYIRVDPRIVDGTPTPDFFIHLWDGDNNATHTFGGRRDYDRVPVPGHSVFEYRLYGGPGAAINDEGTDGENPTVYHGTLIDIDGDPGDDTLRTNDADDLNGTAPENLRNSGFSLIAVDADMNPGDFVDGMMIYKFVVDGTFGPGHEWNRYEIQVTRDAARIDPSGCTLSTFELTYAGRPNASPAMTKLYFRVPGQLMKPEIDLQTLDLDFPSNQAIATLTTKNFFYDTFLSYESGNGLMAGTWQWTSLNQPVSFPFGNGFQGFTYPTTGEEDCYWRLDIDPIGQDNPFSIRLLECGGAPLPLEFLPMTSGQPNTPSAGLWANGAGYSAVGGPFFVIGDAGAPLALDWEGPPHSDLVLITGPRHAGGRTEGCLGFLDVGTPPFWLDVIIVATSFDDGFRLDANGRAHQDIPVPTGISGSIGTFQGIVYQPVGDCPWRFTSAYSFSVY